MVRAKMVTAMRWYAQDEVNQEESEQNEVKPKLCWKKFGQPPATKMKKNLAATKFVIGKQN